MFSSKPSPVLVKANRSFNPQTQHGRSTQMIETTRPPVMDEKRKQARRIANEKFLGEPDWVRFYREVLAVDGIVDKLFPTFEQRNQFEKTGDYQEIQQMLAKLRERNRVQKNCDEPTRVITVRLPQSLHEALRHEAHNYKTSMNKLCISKLLQVIEGELIPSDFERHEEEQATVPPRAQVAPPTPAPIPVMSGPINAPPIPMAAPVHAAPPSGFSPRPAPPPTLPGGATF
jgi:predicted HicB family RNase H-like nuclease